MKLTTGLCALGLSMLLLGGCAQQERRMEALTEQAAQTLAVEAAGLSGTEVVFASTELERRDGVDYYQVVFSSGEKNYECDVDAITGTVIEVRQPTEVDVLQNGTNGLSNGTPPEGSLVTDADTYNPVVPAGSKRHAFRTGEHLRQSKRRFRRPGRTAGLLRAAHRTAGQGKGSRPRQPDLRRGCLRGVRAGLGTRPPGV